MGATLSLDAENARETAAEWSRDMKHGVAFIYNSDGNVDAELVYDRYVHFL